LFLEEIEYNVNAKESNGISVLEGEDFKHRINIIFLHR
jgi:hypothetical protein